MQKLTRKWRKSPRESHFDEDDKFSLPTRDENRPIDFQEQEELVRSLENLQTQQSLLWRGVFSGLLSCYVAFLLYSVYQQAYYPWELRFTKYLLLVRGDKYLMEFAEVRTSWPRHHGYIKQRYHAYFMYEVDAWTIIAADWAAIMTCLMTIKGLLHESKHHRRWLWSSCCIGMIVAVFWLHHMLRLAKFRWDVVWLPLGPICGAGVCIYVEYLLNVSSEEVRKLRGYMYAYKAR